MAFLSWMRQLPHLVYFANNKYIGMILDTTSYWEAITYCLIHSFTRVESEITLWYLTKMLEE